MGRPLLPVHPILRLRALRTCLGWDETLKWHPNSSEARRVVHGPMLHGVLERQPLQSLAVGVAQSGCAAGVVPGG